MSIGLMVIGSVEKPIRFSVDEKLGSLTVVFYPNSRT